MTSTKSSLGETFYLCKTVKNKESGKFTSKVVERLGTKEEIYKRIGENQDLKQWLKEYAESRTKEEKNNIIKIPFYFKPNSIKEKDTVNLRNGGYLFLQKILYDFDFHEVCEMIQNRENLNFDLFSVLSTLIYKNIFYSSINKNSVEFSKQLIEQQNFTRNDIYKAIKILAKYSDMIQIALHKYSKNPSSKLKNNLYYHSFNFFIEHEEWDNNGSFFVSNIMTELRLYFNNKAYPIFFACGQKNDDLTTIEDYILLEYPNSSLVYLPDCIKTNATKMLFEGFKKTKEVELLSVRSFNQGIQQWALNQSGWKKYGEDVKDKLSETDLKLKFGNLSSLEYGSLMHELFYKKKKIVIKDKKTGKDIKTNLYVFLNYGLKKYEKELRKKMIERLNIDIELFNDKTIKLNDANILQSVNRLQGVNISSLAKKRTNKNGTEDFEIDLKELKESSKFDGYFAVCSGLELDEIFSTLSFIVTKTRIADLFNNVSDEFRPRKDFSQSDSLKAHFFVAYMSLRVFNELEEKLNFKFWSNDLVDALRSYNFYKISDLGWVPAYTPGRITDALQKAYNINTDFEFLTAETMENILSSVAGDCV